MEDANLKITNSLPTDYKQTLVEIKKLVASARYQSFRAVNKELITLYWKIGQAVFEKTQSSSWGSRVVEQLAKDLQKKFPGVSGFSSTNVWRMRIFYMTYADDEKLARTVQELGWGVNIELFTKIKDIKEREFYIQMCQREGWVRSTLVVNIKAHTYQSYLLNQNNFERTISEERLADLSYEFKDQYNTGLLEITSQSKEREIEDVLVKNINNLLAEMGKEVLFAGRQYRLEINDKEFFVDLMFYHRKLKCFIAMELKADEFKFEHMGQLSGYLSTIDATIKKEDENPTIGILICKQKDRTVVEYALRGHTQLMAVGTYSYQDLPKAIAKYLPSDEELKELIEDEEISED
jgi:predicted nuclease of restriction endonuclease-like (RecB) superfamily